MARQYASWEEKIETLDRQIERQRKQESLDASLHVISDNPMAGLVGDNLPRRALAPSAFDDKPRILAKGEPLCTSPAPYHLGHMLCALVGVGDRRRAIEIRGSLSEGSDSAGGVSVPELIAQHWFDLLRQRSVVLQAGAQTVPLESDAVHVVKLASDPQFAWRSELGPVDQNDPSFARITLAPRSGAVLVRMSRELLADSVNASEIVLAALVRAGAAFIDQTALTGSGTAPEPRGILSQVGIQEILAVGELDSYAALVQAHQMLAAANATPATAYIFNPRDSHQLYGLTATDGQPLTAPAVVQAVPLLETTGLPVNDGVGTNEGSAILGNFEHALWGIRQELRVEVLREAFASTLEIAFLSHMRWDFAVAHPEAFVALRGITPPAAP